jgi:hypothetical protein
MCDDTDMFKPTMPLPKRRHGDSFEEDGKIVQYRHIYNGYWEYKIIFPDGVKIYIVENEN